MKTLSYALRRIGFPARHSMTIRTTLYALIEAIVNEVGPDEDALVTPTAMHLLGAHKARFIGKRVRSTV
jgi:hypothetical protein